LRLPLCARDSEVSFSFLNSRLLTRGSLRQPAYPPARQYGRLVATDYFQLVFRMLCQ
jgi:hypothetical protein